MLPFRFDIDRDFIVPLYFKFTYVYGGSILLVHGVVFYLLIFHSKHWARAVRVGYCLNQAQMLAHDVWACFVFRPYPILPYPALIFTTKIIAMIGGPNAYLYMLNSSAQFVVMLKTNKHFHKVLTDNAGRLLKIPSWRNQTTTQQHTTIIVTPSSQ